MLTDVGPVEVRIPRDVACTFEPQIVRKRQRRLTGADELVLSLSARGLAHGEVDVHLAEVYGTKVSKQTISTIPDKVIEGMAEWQNRPLDPVWRLAAIKIRCGSRMLRRNLVVHVVPKVRYIPSLSACRESWLSEILLAR